MKKDIFPYIVLAIVAVVGLVAISAMFMTSSTYSPPQDIPLTAGAIIGNAYKTVSLGKSSDYIDGDYSFTLDSTKQVTSLKISGSVELKKETGQVTIVLVDINGVEYLVHEGYVLLNGKRYSLADDCEETCIMEAVYPQKLNILAVNAKVTITGISTELDGVTTLASMKLKAKDNKKVKDSEKVQKLSDSIDATGQRWTAGETSISALSYRERKARMMDVGNKAAKYGSMYGLEFYTGGIFDYPTETGSVPTSGTSTGVATASSFPQSFDWRNVHGENWMSPTSDQGWCGSCWDFAATGQVESYANVYFNQHLDLDLSEQDGLSSSGGGSCRGGWPSPVLAYYSTTGAIPESCFAYTSIDANGCNYDTCGYTPQTSNMKCSDWQTKTVKFPMYKSLDYSVSSNVQKSIIAHGPINMCQAWGTGGHCIVYMGYSVDPSTGVITWAFQNSWGAGWGEGGFSYMTNPPWWSAEELNGPIVMAAGTPAIACNDKDADGFCNWGVSGTKPNTCAVSCNVARDCDDSNAAITSGSCEIPTTGSISATSTPSGASVLVDGVNMGVTPLTLNGVAEGTHSIGLSLAGYCGYSTSQTVNVGQTTLVSANLGVASTVSVGSTPSGASVTFDSQNVGITPLSIPNVCTGSHQVLLSLAGYMDYSTTVTMAGQAISISPTLVGSGSLYVTSNVVGSVYVDGTLRGKTPLTIAQIGSGSHTIKVSAKNYADYSASVNVVQGQKSTVSATMTRSTRGRK